MEQAKKMWGSYPEDMIRIKYFLYPVLLTRFDVINHDTDDPLMILVDPKKSSGQIFSILYIDMPKNGEPYADIRALMTRFKSIMTELGQKKFTKVHLATVITERIENDEKQSIDELVCTKV